MNKQQTEQRAASGSLLERIGEAQIEGERRRLAKMTSAQRARDSSARKVVSGIFTFFNLLVALGIVISLFVAYPVCRIPLAISGAAILWLAFRKDKR